MPSTLRVAFQPDRIVASLNHPEGALAADEQFGQIESALLQASANPNRLYPQLFLLTVGRFCSNQCRMFLHKR